MARKLDSMDLKQIITLHLDGISNRKIANTLGILRNTVNHYLKLFNAGKYDLKELFSFDNCSTPQLQIVFMISEYTLTLSLSPLP